MDKLYVAILLELFPKVPQPGSPVSDKFLCRNLDEVFDILKSKQNLLSDVRIEFIGGVAFP